MNSICTNLEGLVWWTRHTIFNSSDGKMATATAGDAALVSSAATSEGIDRRAAKFNSAPALARQIQLCPGTGPSLVTFILFSAPVECQPFLLAPLLLLRPSADHGAARAVLRSVQGARGHAPPRRSRPEHAVPPSPHPEPPIPTGRNTAAPAVIVVSQVKVHKHT